MGLTSIVVSHDLEQTFRIADQVVILANGKHRRAGHARRGAPEHRPAGAPVRQCQSDGPVRFHYPARRWTRRAPDFAARQGGPA
jgi:phospholipid/cholesterol/gamma-HCH transport system ATP-binding protein